MNNINIITIFLTGLLAGGLTCMAVQGGLLATTIAQIDEKDLRHNRYGALRPILLFLFAKIVAYSLLGFFLGMVGSVFHFSLTTNVLLQLSVGIFMIGTAFNMLHIHPFFRYFVIQPPHVLTRFIRKHSKNTHVFTPLLLGALTIIIPCGTTQALMVLAVSAGNPVIGALVLFSFTLGTSPLFLILGYGATKLGALLQERFMQIAAYAIILLAIFNMNNAVALSGSPITLETLGKDIYCTFSICSVLGAMTEIPSTTPIITIASSGYSPARITIKAGQQITLTLRNIDSTNCTQAFTIPTLGIQKIVPEGIQTSITFTAPEKPQEISFMCSMGMYRGTIQVI